jgi:imidazolonepropionase-like amidohydrolase
LATDVAEYAEQPETSGTPARQRRQTVHAKPEIDGSHGPRSVAYWFLRVIRAIRSQLLVLWFALWPPRPLRKIGFKNDTSSNVFRRSETQGVKLRRLLVATTASLVLSVAASGQSASLAITDVTVIDGTGRAAHERMTVIVRDGRIVAVDSASRALVPARARVVDGRGKFLIPGLWDMHVHLAKGGEASLGLLIANGVTSVRDMGGDFALVHRWRLDISSGARVGPRITAAGPILENARRVERMKAQGGVEPVDRFRAPVADTIDARRVVDSVARLGVDHIKVRTVASPEAYHAIAAAARRVGRPLVAHGDVVSPEEMLRAGQRSIEHAIYPPLQKRDASLRAQLIRDLAAARVAIVPTMVNYYQWLLVSPGDARRIVDDSLGRIDARRRYISGYLLDDWREQVAERGRVMDALIRHLYLPRAYNGVLRDLREMHAAGVPILPGTDLAVALIYPGFSLRDELGYFVDKIAMTPMAALESATRVAADFSGMLDSLGTVQVGKLADLVLLDADPLADIRNVGRIYAVIARGDLFDRDRLSGLLAAAQR